MKVKQFVCSWQRVILLTLVSLGSASLATAQSVYEDYTFTTLAGPGMAGPGWFDGIGSAARFNGPAGIARDAQGNLYVADSANNTIRKITPAGEVTTFAGLSDVSGTSDGMGGAARFNSPFGVVVDGSGNVFVADQGNHAIRKISPSGNVTTFAGLAGVLGSVDGTNGTARFQFPSGLAIDSNDNIYVADTGNDTIRKITPDGVVTTFAGSAGVAGSADKKGTSATFYHPFAIAVDANGNLYVADFGNDTIRKITPSAVVSTLAGSAGVPGYADGPGKQARFNSPEGISVDGNFNVYVTDTGSDTIRMITPDGTVSTPLGVVISPGSVDANGTSARFNLPLGICVDANTNLYIADFGNNTIRKADAGFTVTTLVGSPGGSGSVDAMGSAARFKGPSAVAVNGNGVVFVTDFGNETIRKVTPDGTVTTLAGQVGVTGTNNGNGLAASFNGPAGLTLDPNGNLFIADDLNNAIREITPGGDVTTFAGLPGSVHGTNDGFGTDARFSSPIAVAADTNGTVYVADINNETLRQITPDGDVTTYAGTVLKTGTNDGPLLSASFNGPKGLAIDGSHNIYVVDNGSSTIRKIIGDTQVTTFAGTPLVSGSTDATGTAALFNGSFGAAADANGNIYIGDAGNNTIRKITPAGVVTTIGGVAGQSGNLDGNGSDALFNLPEGVAVDAEGNVYVADSVNNSIRKGYPALPDRPVVDLPYGQVGVTRHFSISNLTTISWSWTLVRRPANSTAQLSATNISNPTFTPDVEDVYVIQFQGWDNSGHTSIRRLTVVADDTPPSLSITNPISGQSLSNGTVTVSGTATDNLGLAGVWVQANGGAWTQATGNTNWSLNVSLTPGANVVRAYAEDSTGNISQTNEVDFTYIVSAPLTLLVNGGGTVTPDLDGVLLEVGKTYSITAQPGTGCAFVNWTGDIQTNSPTITFMMQSNLTLIANFTDPIKPNLAISWPKKGSSVSNDVFVANGTATDNGQLASVWCQLNDGSWIQATNTAAWTAGVSGLNSGANTLRAYAVDTFNNISTTNSVTFNYVPSKQIIVQQTGSGTLTPNYNGWLLQIGKSYSMTAKPGFGYLFVNWTDGGGNMLSTAQTLKFTVQTNLTVAANFILNPFNATAGPYAGLFYDTNGVATTSAGFASISATALGGFTAKLTPLAGKPVSFSGNFTIGGVFSNSVSIKGSTPFLVQLQMDQPNDRIIGSISNSGWTAQLEADRAPFSPARPAPQGGKNYTLVIPGGADSSVQPGGNGYGTVKVDVSGNVIFTGALGDGAKAAQKTTISKDGRWPFFVAPYKGLGGILGWLTFTTNLANTDISGSLNWMVQPQQKAKLYPGGFSFPNTIQVLGSVYSFTNGLPLLNLPAGGASILQQGNLPESFTNHFTLGSNNKTASSDGLSVTITTKTGLFKGTARDPNNGKSVLINGVLLQKQNSAYGTFLGTDQSGPVYLGP